MSPQVLRDFRRKWGIVSGGRASKPSRRTRAMARLDNWDTVHGFPPEPSVRMKQAVIALFADMEREAGLD